MQLRSKSASKLNENKDSQFAEFVKKIVGVLSVVSVILYLIKVCTIQ